MVKLRAQAQLTIAAICLDARRRALEQRNLASQTSAGQTNVGQTNVGPRTNQAAQGNQASQPGVTPEREIVAAAVPTPTISTLYDVKGGE